MAKILITGGTSFLGIPLVERLKEAGHEVTALSSKDYNLTEQSEVRKLFKEHSPDVVYHLAAKVGGIMANKNYPADFCYQNLAINTYFLEEARKSGIKRLIYTFGGCSFPNKAPNPIREESLWNGFPAPESAYYSLAKAIGHLQICSYRKQYGVDFVSCIPGNAYGKYDNFSLEGSHVVPGMIRKFHESKLRNDSKIILWGTGRPLRDFVFSEDVADALVLALDKHHTENPITISSGKPTSIKELAEIVKEIVGFKGEIEFDVTKVSGQQVKIFNVERMEDILGFKPKVGLKEGVAKTYKWFVENLESGKVRL